LNDQVPFILFKDRTLYSGNLMTSLTSRKSRARLAVVVLVVTAALAAARPPNVVIILTDDQGYGDLGAYGAKDLRTPQLDQLAAEGMRFTDFYAAAAVCSASRAALLSGCYPVRVSIPGVIGANVNYGINHKEQLLPELLKKAGYATALVGKWHLGSRSELWPTHHGFDYWFGTVGSNDMGRDRPSLDARRNGLAGVELVKGTEVVEVNPNQSKLTARYTEHAIAFIEGHADEPFFLYLAHNMPHTPLFASAAFKGRSKRGLYGDVIEEIDDSVGRIIDTLKRLELDDDTLVIFFSDNGPWLIFGDHGGNAGPLAGGKKQTLEGGMRVPCIMRWPGHIKAGSTCRQLVAAMDILPTIVAATGAPKPKKEIDGIDVSALFADPASGSGRDSFFYYWDYELHAVRHGHWKLQLPHWDRQAADPEGVGNGGVRGAVRSEPRSLALFDLATDPGESTDLAAEHPKVVDELQRMVVGMREHLGDKLQRAEGTRRRNHAIAKRTQ
jgi:arylsulfatase A